jgi:hypothetical protein
MYLVFSKKEKCFLISQKIFPSPPINCSGQNLFFFVAGIEYSDGHYLKIGTDFAAQIWVLKINLPFFF